MKQQFKVIHIELNDPCNGKKHFYFGSKAALYQYFTDSEIGIKLESLWNTDLEEAEYSNDLCTIRAGTLLRKKTNRGRQSKEEMIRRVIEKEIKSKNNS